MQRELPLQLTLGSALIAINGYAATEVERAFTRAQDLCEQLGDPPELFPALFGLWAVYYLRGEFRMAYALAEQLMRRAQGAEDSALLIMAHTALGDTSLSMGKPLPAREIYEALTNAKRSLAAPIETTATAAPASRGPFALQ
jgi:predicted ATPase